MKIEMNGQFHGVFTVRIRRGIHTVRQEAEQLEGKSFQFVYGWVMGADDPYPGEVAMIPNDQSYPANAPHWIASSDLVKST